ncbi:hypothetical protein BHE74_00011818 [Ensete ventricosum]|nr:hypothetical protein BHE74_00011818 [Ensete ventricosum]RZR83587.1 hypothetical protein BHM03_00010209 [Ensete ventricosum]
MVFLERAPNKTPYCGRREAMAEWYMASWKLSLAMVLLRRSLAFSSSPSAATAAPRRAASAVALSAGAGTDRRRAERPVIRGFYSSAAAERENAVGRRDGVDDGSRVGRPLSHPCVIAPVLPPTYYATLPMYHCTRQ